MQPIVVETTKATAVMIATGALTSCPNPTVRTAHFEWIGHPMVRRPRIWAEWRNLG